MEGLMNEIKLYKEARPNRSAREFGPNTEMNTNFQTEINQIHEKNLQEFQSNKSPFHPISIGSTPLPAETSPIGCAPFPPPPNAARPLHFPQLDLPNRRIRLRLDAEREMQ
ncbi:hypothetical protein SDJN02_05886, partial [Cucurbita argyrosperma subsp. argyrosperma]